MSGYVASESDLSLAIIDGSESPPLATAGEDVEEGEMSPEAVDDTPSPLLPTPETPLQPLVLFPGVNAPPPPEANLSEWGTQPPPPHEERSGATPTPPPWKTHGKTGGPVMGSIGIPNITCTRQGIRMAVGVGWSMLLAGTGTGTMIPHNRTYRGAPGRMCQLRLPTRLGASQRRLVLWCCLEKLLGGMRHRRIHMRKVEGKKSFPIWTCQIDVDVGPLLQNKFVYDLLCWCDESQLRKMLFH